MKCSLWACLATSATLLSAACTNADRSRNGAQEDMVVSEAVADPDAPATPAAVNVVVRALGNTMQDMRYDVETISVPAGANVTVTLINEGEGEAMVHNIVFVERGKMEQIARAGLQAGQDQAYVPDNPVVLAHSPLVQPGQQVDFTFTAPAAGTYEFVCTYPGHWQKMNGTFVVE